MNPERNSLSCVIPPPKIRVLHVDDEEYFTKCLKLILERLGKYEVRFENRSVNAVQAAREFKPNVLLLEIMMADLYGDKVMDQFKADPTLKNIPIILLTVSSRKFRVQASGGIVGKYPVLAKPATIPEIKAAIDKYAI